VRLFGAATAIVAFMLYVIVTGLGIWFSWNSGDPTWLTSEGTIFWVTGLSALVGGVTAVGLGVKPAAGSKRGLRGLATVLTGNPGWSTQTWIAIVYAGGYLFLGILAGITWATQQGETIDAVRALASASAGMFFAIARASFQPPPA
jgi:hypothetical protein